VRVSILIPWRTDNGPRERAFNHIRAQWEATGAQVCVGVDDDGGPFNCSRAQNRAFRQAKHDTLLMVGADTLPDIGVLCTVDGLNSFDWMPLFEKTAYYSKESTERILAGANPNAEPFEYELPFCTGPVALTREAYIATGGMDERFSGWGYEDAAFRQTLAGLFGAPPAFPATCRCLWHETDHRITVSPNQVLMEDYIPLTDPVSTRAYLDRRGSFL
jgi:hypothetical protein